MLPKINAFLTILLTVTGTVFLAHDDVVYYGKGIRTYSRNENSTNLWWFYI